MGRMAAMDIQTIEHPTVVNKLLTNIYRNETFGIIYIHDDNVNDDARKREKTSV